MFAFGQRSKDVLKFVIQEYIDTGEPVGSRTVAKKSGLHLSPATIRNEMADMEEKGLLFQPHTSAGRVPTEEGVRFFVNALLHLEELSPPEKEEIHSTCHGCRTDACELMRGVCRTLSSFSNYTGIVMPPPLSESTITHVEFIKFRKQQVIAIFVASSGMVQNRIVEIDTDLSQHELDKMSDYLGRLLTGIPLRQVRQRILDEMAQEKRTFDDLMRKALELAGRTMFEGERDLYIEGHTNLLNEPEFADVQRLKELLRAFEEKTLLLTLLDRSMKTEGVQVIFGSECDIAAVDGCSIIAATYGHPGPFVGLLGVIGPMRMNYSRVIPVVDFTAKLLTEIVATEWHNP